jgi:hypothetical protein
MEAKYAVSEAKYAVSEAKYAVSKGYSLRNSRDLRATAFSLLSTPLPLGGKRGKQ